MSETTQAFQWIESTLLADGALTAAATGGVWESYAPIGTVPPFVIYQQQASTDVLTMNGVRLFTNKLMQIKAIGPTSGFATLVTIADRIDANFKSARDVALPSGGILASTREQEISYPELINGQQWSHIGGLY